MFHSRALYLMLIAVGLPAAAAAAPRGGAAEPDSLEIYEQLLAAPDVRRTATLDEAVRIAAEAYRRGANAYPIVDTSGRVLFPHGGDTYPRIACAPLRVCDIELQAGETVLNVAIGDSARWLIARAASGTPPAPHVIIKPLEAGIETNLVITTDRRTYYMDLVARTDGYVPRIGWYYPQDVVQQWADAEALAARREAEEEARTIAAGVSPTALDFGYVIDAPKGIDWRPLRVFSDGKKTYIQLPKDARETPALFAVGPDGKERLINYRFKGDFFIVDAPAAELVLVSGVGKHREMVVIHREGRKPRYHAVRSRWIAWSDDDEDEEFWP